MAEKQAPAKKQSPANNSNGFVVVRKTTITTMQNSKGIKRTIREEMSAPKPVKPAPPTKPKQKPSPARK